MSECDQTQWAADDPRRLGLVWRNDRGLLAMSFVSESAFPPPGEQPGQAELEQAVRAELAGERAAIAAFASWREKLAVAEKEMASIRLQLERADLERRQMLLAPPGAPQLAARLGEIEAERRATARILEKVSEGRQQLLQQAETARQTAERSLRRVIDRCSTRLMERAQADIEAAAQQAAQTASPALTDLAESLMRLRYCSSMGDVLLMRLKHLLTGVPPSTAPAELPAAPPARDESPALPTTATLVLPAGADPSKAPTGIQTGQDGIAAVRVQEAPPPAPVVSDAALANADLTPQPAPVVPAIEQGAAGPMLPEATKPPRRRRAE